MRLTLRSATSEASDRTSDSIVDVLSESCSSVVDALANAAHSITYTLCSTAHCTLDITLTQRGRCIANGVSDVVRGVAEGLVDRACCAGDSLARSSRDLSDWLANAWWHLVCGGADVVCGCVYTSVESSDTCTDALVHCVRGSLDALIESARRSTCGLGDAATCGVIGSVHCALDGTASRVHGAADSLLGVSRGRAASCVAEALGSIADRLLCCVANVAYLLADRSGFATRSFIELARSSL